MFTCTKISTNDSNYYQQDTNNYKFITFIPNKYSQLNTYSNNNYINQTNSILNFNAHINLLETNYFEKDEDILTNSNIYLPEFYSMEQIGEKISDKEIQKKLKEGETEKSYEYNYMKNLNKKTKRDNKEYNNNDNPHVVSSQNKKDKKKRGRKSAIKSLNEHNRMTPDNIIKKIKSILFKYIVEFLNKLLKKVSKKIKLAKLDYKYIKKLKRKDDLLLLKIKLKELLSLNISPKYRSLKKDYNKKIIEQIENKNEFIINDNNNHFYDTLKFVLNLSFGDWLDLFTRKKNCEDLFNYYGIDKNSINNKIIEESFFGINEILNQFEENEKYFSRFVFYLYNYERWFFIKKPRNRALMK